MRPAPSPRPQLPGCGRGALLLAALLAGGCKGERAPRPSLETPGATVLGPSSQGSAIPNLPGPGELLSPDPDWLPPPASHQVLNLPGSEFRDLDPYELTTRQLRELYRLLSDRPARRHLAEPHRWAPELATSAVLSEDGRSLLLHFRDDARWWVDDRGLEDPRYDWLREPHPFTPRDLACALELATSPRATGWAAQVGAELDALEGWDFPDEHSLLLHFSSPRLDQVETVLELEPLPCWLYQRGPDGEPIEDWTAAYPEHFHHPRAVGTGPYRVERWEPASELVLRANPDYWGPAPPFERIDYLVVPDPEARLRYYLSGELDLLVLNGALRERLDELPPGLRERRLHYPEHASTYLVWNLRDPRLQDPRVRRALALAADRPFILRAVFQGEGHPLSSPLPATDPCADPSVPPLPHDPEAARRLLEEAGWRDTDGDGVRDRLVDGQRLSLELELLVFHHPDWDAVAAFLADDFARVGVRLRPVPLERGEMLRRLAERDFTAYTAYTAYPGEPDLFPAWHGPVGGRELPGNLSGLADPELDRLLEDWRAALDPAERLARCREVHARLHALQPALPLFQPERDVLYGPKLDHPAFSALPPYAQPLLWRPAPAPP